MNSKGLPQRGGKTLDISERVFGREQLGQHIGASLPEAAEDFLWQNSDLEIVHATDAPCAGVGDGKPDPGRAPIPAVTYRPR